ncbi:hypothetical protein [Novispirillum itersonii]|uniref:hypothetical protein n=1 Tax=Novispirillum itersonii TaxID=189 RepID=UPI00039BD1E9|nr:hypothetical protein [Novispirillum itersonii]
MSLSSSRMARGTRLLLVSLFATLTVLIGGGTKVALDLRDRNARITALEAELDQARQQIAAAEVSLSERATQLAVTEKEKADLAKKLDNSYAAVPVGGRVDFPIMRGMAREGDTVATFAKREGTTPDVVIALNPWLKGQKGGQLADRASLWIPKR